jgi:mannose-6-phosphate isomerase-like protein (cupin superfamily)
MGGAWSQSEASRWRDSVSQEKGIFLESSLKMPYSGMKNYLEKQMKIIRLKELEFVPAGHEDPKSPGVLIKILLKKVDLLAGQLQMVNWAKMGIAKSFRPHYHQDMEEIFIILKGKARIRIPGEEAELAKEEVVVIPVGQVHEMRNIGDEEVEYLVIGISQGKGGKTIVI